MTPQELIGAAEHMLRRRRTSPRQALLKRAVSTAYYAVFHAAARMAANALVGRTKASTDAWLLTYRAVQHAFVKNVVRRADVQALHDGVRQFASIFIALQELRHLADYDPSRSFTREEAVTAVELAQRGIAALAAVPAAIRLDLAARLLFKPRP
ncbi:hypothetical protein [Salinarimonas chemoclinalis]|uniref:hypothetical protein n=1 Tax=Salinarimonas chemoclinalis TaxID=3241599 RepID=UPI0035560B95